MKRIYPLGVILLLGVCLLASLPAGIRAQQDHAQREVTVSERTAPNRAHPSADNTRSSDNMQARKSEDPDRESMEAEIVLKVFKLKNADATQSATHLTQFFQNASFAADVRTNSIIVQAPRNALEKINAFLSGLDEQPTRMTLARNGAHDDPLLIGPTIARREPSLESSMAASLASHPDAQNWIKEIARIEARAAAIATQIMSSNGADTTPSVKETLRKELDETLTQGLELKFKLEQLQLSLMEERIARLKTQMAKRTASIKQIVERRAQELIDVENFRWTPLILEGSPNPVDTRAEWAVSPPTVPGLPEAAPPVPAALSPERRPSRNPTSDVRPEKGEKQLAETTSALSPYSTYPAFASKLSMMNRNVTRADEELNRLSRAVDQGMVIPAKMIIEAKHQLEDAVLNRKLIQDEYAATLKDLELQVKGASAEFRNADQARERIEQLAAKGAAAKDEVREAQFRQTQAFLALERLNLRFDLYRKAGEVAEVTESSRQDTPATISTAQPTPSSNPSTRHAAGNLVPAPAKPVAMAPAPDVLTTPKTIEQCAEILRVSNNYRELQVAWRTARNFRDQNPHLKQADVELATALIQAIDRTNSDDERKGLKPLNDELNWAWNQFAGSIRIAVFTKILRDSPAPLPRIALDRISPLVAYIKEPEFPVLCDELLKLSTSSDRECRLAALKVLVETLPLTKIDPANFQSAERQDMVKRLKSLVPRERVIANLMTSLDETTISGAVAVATLVTRAIPHVDDEGEFARTIDKTIEILNQIVEGDFHGTEAPSSLRRTALGELVKFQNRSDRIVPILISLLKSDSSELNIDDQRGDNFLREAIITGLEAFGPKSKDAIPILADELVLIKLKSNDLPSNDPQAFQRNRASEERLHRAIDRIRGPKPGPNIDEQGRS